MFNYILILVLIYSILILNGSFTEGFSYLWGHKAYDGK
jgi:hypothetical protein